MVIGRVLDLLYNLIKLINKQALKHLSGFGDVKWAKPFASAFLKQILKLSLKPLYLKENVSVISSFPMQL